MPTKAIRLEKQALDQQSYLAALKESQPKMWKKAVAVRVGEQVMDLRLPAKEAFIPIFAHEPEGLEVIRHSCAHLLAMAVKRLFPQAQVTIGPVIEHGFYYDFYYPPGFTEADLPRIEKLMAKLAKQTLPINRQTMSRDEAIAFFKDQGEQYKAEIIRDIPEDEVLSLYQQDDFTDLCRGPHVMHTGFLSAFKLTKLAGAYWRGDANEAVLQRIYGVAFDQADALKKHLDFLEEAKKRDHRRLGKQMQWFHFQEEAPGLAFWHAPGWGVYTRLETFIRSIYAMTGYQEIKTPQVLDRSLWERSGHWDKYAENMLTIECDKRTYALKPMSCPGHVQVFNQGLKSYRDLPLRLAEFGCCHRYEASGTLHGLMRVRGFVQDDGHIFCSVAQIGSEVLAFVRQTQAVYQVLGFADVQLKLSTRPEKRVGSDAVWDQAESALQTILDESGCEYEILPGEGAFYGPKIEFSLQDCLGRVWQCGTMQVDFSMPERLGAKFINEEGQKELPVMLHRAILGTLERFLGIMIENTAGHMPLWLVPLQVAVLPIGESHRDYAKNVHDELKALGYHVQLDQRSEKINYRIREHTLQRTAFLLVVGEQEQSEGSVNVRDSRMQRLGPMSLSEFVQKHLHHEDPVSQLEKILA